MSKPQKWKTREIKLKCSPIRIQWGSAFWKTQLFKENFNLGMFRTTTAVQIALVFIYILFAWFWIRDVQNGGELTVHPPFCCRSGNECNKPSHWPEWSTWHGPSSLNSDPLLKTICYRFICSKKNVAHIMPEEEVVCKKLPLVYYTNFLLVSSHLSLR